MLSVTSTPVELIDDNTAQQYYNDLDTLEGAERDSRAEALRLWADQKDADQKREQFDTLNKIYSDFDGYVNDAGLQDFDEESRYRTANRQFIASQFDDTVENQQTIYPSFRDKWTESVAGKKGLSEKETFDLIKQGIDARNEVSQAANEIPGDIALALFDSLDGGDPVDVPKLIDTWKTKNAESIKKLPKGWETPLLEAAQKYHTETDTMLRDYAEPLKQVYDHFAAVTGRDTEKAGESNPKNQEELDSLVDTLASMPKPVRERAYASVVLGAKKAGQDPKTFMDQWGESWSRTLNMVRTGALTAQEMAAESEARQLEDKASPPDYYISKSTGEKIPLANRAFHDEADLRKVTPEEIAADAAKARQKVKRFEVVRELQSVADNQFDPIEKINKGGFLGFMEAMAYGTPQSLAYTGTALIPVVGPYLAGTAIFADEYNQLREQGMSVDQAVQVGSVSAGIQAGLERTGAELIFGKLPVFEKLMRRIANPARVGKAGRAGIRFFSAALGENITEGAQDLTTPLVQDVAEALGADVPDVQWQPILEKWSGSRLDVLAATIPTILLGTGVATFGDNKRFAQFEERQDIYRSMGMDDATIKEIEDGKDISEKQQKFQTAFSKLTPENVKAGVAYMEEKIASAQGQQQDPNTPTLTRATLADGTTQFIVRDEQGRIAYRTAEEQSAQIAMRELLRNQITGSTRGIVESLQFIDQVNQAAGRGEDVQKLLIDGAPRTLLDDYEANPTEQNLDNLFATVRAFGQDISEPAELANFPVLASNQGALAEGIFKSVIRIQDGATGVEVMRDFSQDNLKRAIAENRVTMDWVREQLNQVIPLIESDRLEGRSLRTETDTDVIESFSDVAVAYMNGRIRDEQVPAGFRGFLRRMAIVVKDIFRRAYRLKRAIAEGKVDSNFESFLAESVGLNQQTLTDTVRDKAKTDIVTDGGQMLMDFSIGSRANAVSNDTPALRAGNATIVSPTNFSIGAYHGTPHKVDRFSTGKIGTGEGAQVYGWGLYFAEAQNVAKTYADTLGMHVKVKGQQVYRGIDGKTAGNAPISNGAIGLLQGKDWNLKAAQEEANARAVEIKDDPWFQKLADELQTLKEADIEIGGGNLYTVNLDVEPEDLLDWDKPLAEQSEKVQAILKQAALNLANDDSFFDRDLQALEVARAGKGKPLTGNDVYADIQEALESRDSKAASEYLFSLGIPGIRYLDGGSRGRTTWQAVHPKGGVNEFPNEQQALAFVERNPEFKLQAPDQTYNYVIFDESKIKITEENGQPVAMQEAQAGAVSTDTGATNYSIGKKQDADYLAAVERGDMETAQRMVDEAAKAAGYLPHGDFRDSHTAPSGPEGTDEEVKNGNADASLVQVARGVHIQPDDYFDPRVGPRYYSYQDKAGMEAFKAIRAAMDEIQQGKKAFVTVFRAVPNDIKGTKLENRDWVTPSKTYAVDHGESRFGEGEYRIIKESVPAENLFWDGNDIREWGKDDGKNYTYKNTKNNRKLIDPVTYDKNGNVIPLSKRFNPRSADINYSIGFAPNGKPSNLKPEDQALARSPEFKARVGDWETLAKQKVLELLPQHTPSIDIPKNLKGKELKNVVKPFYEKQKTTGFILPDGIKINITNRGWKEINIHGADSRVLHIAANLQELLSRSLHLWSENNTDNKYPNVKNFHNYGTRATLNGIDSYIRFVIREDTNGQIHYDHDATSVEVFSANKNGEEGSQPTRNPNPGEDLASLAKNRLYQWWNSVNPESVTVKTDENGEPLASEIARFRQETGTSNYSIASQSEIDRVNKALGGMNRGPDERLKVYERAKAKFSTLLQSNQQALDNLRAGTVSFRRTQLLQALGELDAILSIFPPDIRGRVGGYTRLASIAPHDVFKDGEKVSEVSGMNGAIISAWMREGQNIGEAGKQTELPPGYTAKENLGTARSDKAIADFFKKRIEMIDRELEKTLRREYDEAFRKLLDRTKPKKAAPGEKPKGIGGDIQDLFAVVRDSVDMSATQVAAHIAGLDTMIASGELTAEQEARAQVEAALVSLTGDWKNADADRRRTALMEASRIWNGAYATHTQKLIRQREEREIARAEAIVATGKAGELAGRKSKAISDSGLKGSWKDYILNLLNFDQVVGVLFGENTDVANTIIDKQRRAENAKEDGSQAKMQELEDFFTGLAGGKVLDGERLRYRLTQPSMTVDGIEMSELEALSAVMMWSQEDGRRHMEGEMDETGKPSGKWHYNQAFVDEILANLSTEALALRDWLGQRYANEYANINAVYSELNGVNLPQIRNYSPVTVQPVNAPTGQVLDPVSGSAMSGASTSPGALRTRGTAIAEPRFQNVLQTYISHTLQMEHWKAFAPMVAEANGILRNRDVQNSVEEKGGAEARKMLNAWLDYFAQGGTRDAGAHLALNQGLNNVLGRVSQVALVGKASTLLIQSTQLGAALAEMPLKAYLKRMGKLLTGQLGWDSALNSDYIQRRVKQMPQVVQLAMQGLKGAKPTTIQQAGKRLGMLLSGADGFFTAGTYAITYDYHLTKGKELGLAGQEAEDYARNTAERVTDRIAQPTRAGARSLYENTSTNPLARAGWAFASEARKNLALVAYSFAERDTATKMRTLAYVVALNAIGSAILRSIWRDILDDEDEELFDDKYWSPKRIAMAIATEPFYGFPVLGSVVQEAVYKSFGEYKPAESLFSVDRAVGPIKRLPDHLSGDTDMREVMRDIDMVISSLGIMHANIAATASITHLAKDLFNLGDSAVDAVTED